MIGRLVDIVVLFIRRYRSVEQRISEVVGNIDESGENAFRVVDEISRSEPKYRLCVMRSQNANDLPRSNAVMHFQQY
jgi:hypothetical protein